MTAWNDESHDLLDHLILQLEQAWQAGTTVDLAQFVPPTDHPVREQALLALIQTDQELRWQHGRPKSVEEYLAEWPELRERPEYVAELQKSEQRLQTESQAVTSTLPSHSPAVQPRATRIRCPHCH